MCVCRYSKLRKKRTYEHDSVMEAVQMSIENLRQGIKQFFLNYINVCNTIFCILRNISHASRFKHILNFFIFLIVTLIKFKQVLTYALQRNPILCVPRKKTARPQSQFPHSCLCELFIYSQDRSTYFPASRIGRPIVVIYMYRSQTYECGNCDWGRVISFLVIIVSNFGIVSLQCREKHYFPLLTLFYTRELGIDVFHVMAPQPVLRTLLFNIGNGN
jgi:hypothetical protein